MHNIPELIDIEFSDISFRPVLIFIIEIDFHIN